MVVWNLVLAVHILAMTAWVGGMAYALLVLRPSLAVLPGADQLRLHGEAFRRFFAIVWIAMPLVLVSGWLMVFGLYGGFANLPWAVNVMQLIGIVMTGIFLVLVFGPYRRFRAQPGPGPAASIRKLIHANLGFGVLTIIIATFAQWGG